MQAELNLLVLRCRDLAECRAFYEVLGLAFVEHAHGSGPMHFACEIDGFVFELYPAAAASGADQTGVGFSVEKLDAVRDCFVRLGFSPAEIKQTEWGVSFVVRDPDGRRVEIKQQG